MVRLEIKHEMFKDVIAEGDPPSFKTLVAGEWYTGEEKDQVISPIDHSVIATIPRVSPSVAEKALSMLYGEGRTAFRDVPGVKRLAVYHKTASLIEDAKEDFVDVLVKNAGKTYASANGEVGAAIERLRSAELDLKAIGGDYVPGDWSPETVETEAIVKREPLGVVLGILPFNYPLFDAASKILYSTLPGNSIAVKPASYTPLPTLMLARAFQLGGLPVQSLAILTIRGRDMDGIVKDSRISSITLTGSSETGNKVIRTGGIKQYVMELGGGDPAVVLDDADIPMAAKRIASAIYSYTGQRCDSIKLILAEPVVYDQLKEAVSKELGVVKIGDPTSKDNNVGPLIDDSVADEMQSGIGDALAFGGKVIAGGERLGANYYQPTLIEVDKEKIGSMKLYNTEIFAPISLITKVDGVEEALRLANGRKYGLDAAIFGEDVNKIRRLARMLEVGAVYINDAPRHGIGYFPFGGRKVSGIGVEGIGYTLEHVTGHKAIVYNYKGRGVWEYL